MHSYLTITETQDLHIGCFALSLQLVYKEIRSDAMLMYFVVQGTGSFLLHCGSCVGLYYSVLVNQQQNLSMGIRLFSCEIFKTHAFW